MASKTDKFFTKGAWVLWIALMTIPLWFSSLAIIEGKLFPVTSTMELVKVEHNLDGDAIFWGNFVKRRNCEYIGMFASSDGLKMNIKFNDSKENNSDTADSRPAGDWNIGPWRIFYPLGSIPSVNRTPVIMKDLDIIVEHHCHPFWTTITQFYP